MAKNLKVGDLVKVKIGCEDISCGNEWFAKEMRLYEGKEFEVAEVNRDELYELKDISKEAKYLDVEDWSFSGKWLTKLKKQLKGGCLTKAEINNLMTPFDYPVTSKMFDEPKPTDKRQVAMIKSSTGMTLILDGKTYNLQQDHINYVKIVERLAKKEYSDLEELINISKAVEEFGEGKLSVAKGVVKYNNKELHGCITDSILGLIKDGFSVEPIVNFLDNLSKNPSFRAQNELYSFLEYGKLPITEDGCFLTYKKIRNDWKDIHSGKFDNSIGAVCEMPRHEVDDNSSNTCSSGLHVCSYEYTKSFGGSDSRLVLCKVNPSDVVSIPVDYSNTKMRCCKYKVVAEVQDHKDVLKGKSLYKEPKC